MPTRKIKPESEKFEDEEEFAEAMQSQGSVVSELPSRYRNNGRGAGGYIGPIILFIAIVVGGYVAYGYLTKTTTTDTPNSNLQNMQTGSEQAAFPPPVTLPPAEAPVETQTPPAETTTPVTVEVRNGSSIAGLAKRVGDTLAQDSAYTIAKVGNAANNTYANTLVVVVSKTISSATANAVAGKVGGMVSLELPASEAASSADVLVILGADQLQDVEQ